MSPKSSTAPTCASAPVTTARSPSCATLGLSATTRLSFGPYNATDDLDALLAGLHHITALLGQWGSVQTHSELAGHSRHPRNFGTLAAPDLHGQASVELCGDDLGVHLRVTEGRVAAIRFHGHGCALAISAASYASDRYAGLRLAEISALTADWALGLLPTHIPAIREPCAVLHLRAVQAALAAGTGQPSATQRNRTQTHPGEARAGLLQGSQIPGHAVAGVVAGPPPTSGGPAR